jgi:Kelch motif
MSTGRLVALADARHRVSVLIGLIVLAAVIGLIGWLVRYQPLGPPGPLGTPLPGSDPAAGGWRPEADAPFARLEMATAVFGGRMWLAGGLNPDGSATAEVRIFDPVAGTWSDGPPLPEAVHHAALASDGERLYLVGGYRPPTFDDPTADVLVLDPDGGGWKPGAQLPEPRAAGAIAWDGSRLVYGGGVGPGGNRAEVFALGDTGWRRIGSLARPRQHLAAASDRAGRTWFLAGRQGGLDRNVGDVDLVEGDGVRALTPITPRGGVAAFFAGSLGACLSGGEAPLSALAIVECVDASGRVTALPSMVQRRHGHGAGVVEGRVYVVLGGDVPGLDATSTVESLAIGR